ncbi:collagen alpha-1(XVII) chain-like [Anthonomus grandis grandis]|uniref:collagen alpha-1(XVII) chain-like n=1 Tax=Anthonomus grandis grandis TaxID=2921223 RepID=UPI0021667AE1|nr:collagen alpha-1(XVII) chain-like [Anthonomus grandis grandis]
MFTRRSLIVFITLLVLQALAEDPASEPPPTTPSDKSEYKKSLSRDCANVYTATCLKLDIVSWVDKLSEDDDFNVMPGVSLVRENGSARSSTADIVAELARDFPNDPDARLDAFLMKKVTSYLNSHSVRLDLFNKNAVEEGRGRGGGGGGGGGKGGGGGGGGGMGMMMAAGAMMKGTLMALALGGIAAIAGKALMTGLISLLLSAIIGLKALTHQGHKSTTYEIVSKPIYTQSHTHSESHEGHGGHYGHSSYGRSFDMPLPLGLRPEYKPA